jgi:hypothetical protein
MRGKAISMADGRTRLLPGQPGTDEVKLHWEVEDLCDQIALPLKDSYDLMMDATAIIPVNFIGLTFSVFLKHFSQRRNRKFAPSVHDRDLP